MFNFFDVEQNTDEWFSMRAGKLTLSKLGVIMANFGKSFGEPAKKYAVNIALEQITGKPMSSDYSNDHMQRGHEQEPLAREQYENDKFCDVKNGGFFSSGFVGCSPDGLVENDGVIEIKSVIASTHFATLKRQKIDPAYKWQCIGNLKFTEREWLDFVSYCSEFTTDEQLIVYRIYKKDLIDEFLMIDSRILEFKKLVEETKKTIQESNYFL